MERPRCICASLVSNGLKVCAEHAQYWRVTAVKTQYLTLFCKPSTSGGVGHEPTGDVSLPLTPSPPHPRFPDSKEILDGWNLEVTAHELFHAPTPHCPSIPEDCVVRIEYI